MSLINQMLQDLSTRAPAPADVLGGVRLAEQQRLAPRPGGRAFVFVALVAGVAAALVSVLERAQPPVAAIAQSAVPETTPAAPVPPRMELVRFQLAMALAEIPAGPPRRRERALAGAAAEPQPQAELAAVEVTAPRAEDEPTATTAAEISAESRRRLARQAIARKDYASALALLEPNAPAVQDDPEYHGLLASAYQRLDRHGDAARKYEALLQAQPEQAYWWAGLGLSRDALGDTPGALQAYAQAREGGRLEPRVLDHIKQRTAALQAG